MYIKYIIFMGKNKGAHKNREISLCVYLYTETEIYFSVVYEVKNSSSWHTP